MTYPGDARPYYPVVRIHDGLIGGFYSRAEMQQRTRRRYFAELTELSARLLGASSRSSSDALRTTPWFGPGAYLKRRYFPGGAE